MIEHKYDLSGLQVDESDPEFWTVTFKHIDKILDRLWNDGVGIVGEPLNHLSIFALAPIPILIFLGKKLGNIISADVYQRHRSPASWKWNELKDENFDYIVSYPEEIKECENVAINLSLSSLIHPHVITQVIGEEIPMYNISIINPNVDFLKAKEQLELFNKSWRFLLSKIRETHGAICEVHIFPAIPAPIAVEIGKSILPNVDPKMRIYNKKQQKGFEFVLSV